MQKRLAVKPHLSLQEIETRYRQAKDPVARSHWQIVWLLAQGKTTKQIAAWLTNLRQLKKPWVDISSTCQLPEA